MLTRPNPVSPYQSAFKGRPARLLALLLASLGHTLCAASYEQDFNAGADNLRAYTWSALAGIGTSASVITDLSDETTAIGVSASNGGYAFFAPKASPTAGDLANEPGLYYTAEAPFADVASITEVNFDWIGDNTNATLRVAIKVGGQWHASQQAYQDTRSNPGAGASFVVETFNPANFALAANWHILDAAIASSAGPMTLGSVPTSDLSGPVEAIGVLLDAGSTLEANGDHVRLGRLQVMGGDFVAGPPNILFITIDDLNDVPGFMGSNPDALTPHMDALAHQGTVFRRAYCNYPLCGPSRASFMSGLMPTTLGFQNHMTNSELKTRTNELGATLLHEYFKQQGYKTMSCGKIYHAGQPPGVIDQTGGTAAFGAREALNYSHPQTSTDWGVPASADEDDELSDYANANWAVARLGETHNSPFLLMVGFVQPHVPWYAPQSWFDLYNRNALTVAPYLASDFDDIPQEAEDLSLRPQYPRTSDMIAQGQRQHIQQAYLACVSFTDHYLGQVITALENSPYADNTIVVVFSDHGYHLGEKNTYQKETLWERSGHVPLLFAGPGIGVQQVSGRVVSLLDIYPTLIDLCGLPENPMLEGNSLRPLLENAAAEWTHPAVTSYLGNNHAVQSERYRYTLWNDGSEELYDHQTDPDEHVNIEAVPAVAPIKAELRKALPTNLKSTGFRTRFAPNSGTSSAYLSQMLAAGDISIYDQPVTNTNTVVQGMKLATSTDSSGLTLELEAAGDFGTWRETMFTARELRNLTFSGIAGNADKDTLQNGIEFALGNNPKVSEPAPAMNDRVFSFLRAAPFPSDLTLVVKSASQLNAWGNLATRPAGQGWTGSVSEAPEGDRIRVTLPATADTSHFYRLEASTP